MCRWILLALSLLIFMQLGYGAIHDPTAPPSISMDIKALIVAPHKKEVIVGDRRLTIGDELFGAKIVDINASYVTLKDDQKTFKVFIFKQFSKEPKAIEQQQGEEASVST